MADKLRMALSELLRKADLEPDADFLREGVKLLAEELMELEVSQEWVTKISEPFGPTGARMLPMRR